MRHKQHGEKRRASRNTYGDEGVPRGAVGVGGGEDGVDEDERADDLGGEGAADRVTVGQEDEGGRELGDERAVDHLVSSLVSNSGAGGGSQYGAFAGASSSLDMVSWLFSS
jgi:hypothetical protein